MVPAFLASGKGSLDFGPFHLSTLTSGSKFPDVTPECLSSRGRDTEFPSQIPEPSPWTREWHGLEVPLDLD